MNEILYIFGGGILSGVLVGVFAALAGISLYRRTENEDSE